MVVRRPFFSGRRWLGAVERRDLAPDQDRPAQLLRLEEVRDVLDEGVDRDGAGEQVPALAEPSQRRGEDALALGAQPLADRRPMPTAAPDAVDEHVGLAADLGQPRRLRGGPRRGEGQRRDPRGGITTAERAQARACRRPAMSRM
jgi:hypothetical protein